MLRLRIVFLKKYLNYPLSILNKNPSLEIIYKQQIIKKI